MRQMLHRAIPVHTWRHWRHTRPSDSIFCEIASNASFAGSGHTADSLNGRSVKFAHWRWLIIYFDLLLRFVDRSCDPSLHTKLSRQARPGTIFAVVQLLPWTGCDRDHGRA